MPSCHDKPKHHKHRSDASGEAGHKSIAGGAADKFTLGVIIAAGLIFVFEGLVNWRKPKPVPDQPISVLPTQLVPNQSIGILPTQLEPPPKPSPPPAPKPTPGTGSAYLSAEIVDAKTGKVVTSVSQSQFFISSFKSKNVPAGSSVKLVVVSSSNQITDCGVQATIRADGTANSGVCMPATFQLTPGVYSFVFAALGSNNARMATASIRLTITT